MLQKKRFKNPIAVIEDVVSRYNHFELRISNEHGTIKLDKSKYGDSLKIPIGSNCSVQKKVSVNLLTYELSFEYYLREDFNSGRIKKQEISQNDFDKHFENLHYNIQNAISWDVKPYHATNYSYTKTL